MRGGNRRRSVVSTFMLGGVVLLLLILGMNVYGAWYIANRTGRYGLSEKELDAEIRTTAPYYAKAELHALDTLKPADVRIEPRQLRAWYLPGQPDSASWVLVHGAGNSRTSNIRLGGALNAMGFSVLSLELSYVGRRVFSGGTRESEEILEAVKWLDERTTGPKPFLYGCSTGAYNVLVAEAQGAPVSGVVADSGFVSFPRMSAQASHLPYLLFRPMPYVFPLVGGGGKLVDIERDYGPAEFRVPTLIINGTRDDQVSPTNGPRLANITGGELWAPENGGHCMAFDQNPDELLSRMKAMSDAG